MLDIILQILSVIGIIILVLLVLLLLAVLLILFFPITYRAYGMKKANEANAWVKINWLFGLLRVRFFYPVPGNLIVKLLGFTLFDSSDITEKTVSNENTKHKMSERSVPPEHRPGNTEENKNNDKKYNGKNDNESTDKSNNKSNNISDKDENDIKSRIFAKYEKLKYTILKIYDKIKHITENIAFYKELFQDRQTVELFRHVTFRLGRIFKNIRPRKLNGDIVFGTESPDTTGYVFGMYSMFSAWLGNPINVTPDFTQAILEGELYAAGHITVFQVLLHSLAIVFDKQFQLFVHRIKKHTL